MNYIGKFLSNFKDFYNELNAATLTGAIDAVVVHQEDGSYTSSPFHVRFGKIGVLRSKEKLVDIEINGMPVDIRMKLGETGEAFFVEQVDDDDEISPILGTSPIPMSSFRIREDDLRSQDSGVEEELACKLLKDNPDCDIIRLSSAALQVSLDEQHISCNYVSECVVKTKQESRSVQEQATQTVHTNKNLDLSKAESLPADYLRSRSFSEDLRYTREHNIIAEGQGSKTDIEETEQTIRSNRRKRKRKQCSKKQPKETDGQSSENSTTSETADLSSLNVSGAGQAEDIFLMDDLELLDQGARKVTANKIKELTCLGLIDAVDIGQFGFTPINNAGQSSSMPTLLPTDDGEWPIMSRSMGPDFHPFSDTDISPPHSPSNSRSTSPIKSDTEYENEKQKSDYSKKGSINEEDTKWSWPWGELPTPPTKLPTKSNYGDSSSLPITHDSSRNAQVEEDKRSMIGSMLSFMRATKKARHNPESEGIYLEDLKLDELDPEVAALYFPRNSSLLSKSASSYNGFRPVCKDDDNESGNGPSLPHSPHSVEGAIGGPKICDLDYDELPRNQLCDIKNFGDISFSVCGSLNEYLEGDFPERVFLQSLVTYDDFCENPELIGNPNLVVRMGNKYMNWSTALPQVLSMVLFQRPLPPRIVENVEKENMPKKEMRKRTASRGYSWFPWGRSAQSQQGGIDSSSSVSEIDGGQSDSVIADHKQNGEQQRDGFTPISPETAADGSNNTESNGQEAVIEVVEVKSVSPSEEPSPTQENKENTNKETDEFEDERKLCIGGARFKKTLRLSNDMIRRLNLRRGRNEAVFSVTTAYQGTTRCKCHIFLWNYDEKIVVSDIDGTITKSDVLGHILPIIGKDWAQGGVAQLYTKIKDNGYNFLYLSARAIGQAKITRDYLKSIKQGDVSLPDGPLLLNPTSLVQAFHREVIEKKPEEFKISCLRDIQALFPSNMTPFYAGYGNRVNDVWAYRAVGIPISRIFTINHRGELKHELTQTFQTTYSNLSDIAHHMFPPSPERDNSGEFSTLQFWRPVMPDYSIEIEGVLADATSK